MSLDDDCHDCTNSKVDLRNLQSHEKVEREFNQSVKVNKKRILDNPYVLMGLGAGIGLATINAIVYHKEIIDYISGFFK